MDPYLPNHRRADSSDSDEDSNTRHDRFKSERFLEDRDTRFKSKEPTHYDRYSNKRPRDRSPPRSQKRRGEFSSYYRTDSTETRDIRKKDKEHCFKTSNSCLNERSTHRNNKLELNECRNTEIPTKQKIKLSSILQNFDKKIESKRKNPENCVEIGPSLPPNLQKTCDDDSDPLTGPVFPAQLNSNSNITKEDSNGCNLSDNEGPALPPHMKSISSTVNPSGKIDCESFASEGPALPPCVRSESEKQVEKGSKSEHPPESDGLGPALPPKVESSVYGPVLPPKIEVDSYGPALPPNFKKDGVQGPTLPSGMTAEQLEAIAQEESGDEDMVGPLPEGKMNMTQFQLDLRAMDIKRKLEEEKSGSSNDIKKREEWMLELPPEKAANFGLGPRSFRMRQAPDMSNRSDWTDTPADKLRKEVEALSGVPEPVSSEEMSRLAFVKERDDMMDKISDKSRREDRPLSLLEQHQKKLKKKKKKDEKEGKKKERRPFDRNIDLQVNRFDEAQKKSIFKKAQLLDTRFSTGESKYL